MNSSNLDYSCKLEIIQKKYIFYLQGYLNYFFSLKYDHYLLKTYTDCSKMIHDLENRDLKNFQYFFLACNYSLTNQFMPIKFYMYFLPLKMRENWFRKVIVLDYFSLREHFHFFIWKKRILIKNSHVLLCSFKVNALWIFCFINLWGFLENYSHK